MAFYPDWKNKHFDLPDNINELPVEEAGRLMLQQIRLLHIHGQGGPHGTVRIVGNRNGLVVLRDLINDALREEVLKDVVYHTAGAYPTTSDGEGYVVEITRDDHAWDSQSWEDGHSLPYSDPLYRGTDVSWKIPYLESLLRKANAALVKRGIKPIRAERLDD